MTEHRGSYTVTVTPFDEETQAYDEAAMRSFVDWQIEEGVPGLIILGSMGEFLLIDEDERTHIVESTIDQAAGRIPVFVGTMDAHTDNAVRYSKEAEALGAEGLMITPPYYYTPTEDEIFEYYKAISEAVSIPIMLYNQPFLCNVDMSAAFVAKLTKAFENIRYIKEATGHADRVYDIVRLTDGVMNCFAGNRVYECFLFGATGYVSPPGNYAPRPAVAMWEMLERGEMETAKKISDGFVDFFEAIFE
ncbi:MAG TPA: dihydrodipicolinate synthase family protein, partial [Rhodospirillales bacterium]|nr:dihydrodipicolinate synthase family protein [Rhodospirillales bacterium]